MKIAKAGITGLSATELVAKALLVETKMTGNLNFPTPDPTLLVLKTKREAVETGIVEAASGDHAKVFAKNLAVAELKDALVREAAYVSHVAAGDVLIILGSGLEPRKEAEPIGPLGPPVDLLARAGDKPGEMLVDWAPERGARYYHLEITTDPDDGTTWKLFGVGSKSSFKATGLEPGKAYWFRVQALGSAGPGPYSDPAKGYAAHNP